MKTVKIVIDIKENGDVNATIDNRDGLTIHGYHLREIFDTVIIEALEEKGRNEN